MSLPLGDPSRTTTSYHPVQGTFFQSSKTRRWVKIAPFSGLTIVIRRGLLLQPASKVGVAVRVRVGVTVGVGVRVRVGVRVSVGVCVTVGVSVPASPFPTKSTDAPVHELPFTA